MGTGLRCLICAVCLVLLGCGYGLAEEQMCLTCHPIHYEENGSCTDCHLGRADTRRKEIAHYRMLAARFSAFTLANSPGLERGKKLLEKAACRRCHVSGGKGNQFAANLDWSLHNATAEELFVAIKEPAIFMPDFRFSDRQIVELINAIYGDSRKAMIPEEEVPILVHFEDLRVVNKSVFEEKCGACHRMLTKHRGGLGTGDIGPNLSGMLTEFYPQTHPEKKIWSIREIEDWLKNPRKTMKNATMAPVSLSEEEWLKLQRGVFAENIESVLDQGSLSQEIKKKD